MAGDDRPRCRPRPRPHAPRTGRSTVRARRSVLWRARCWPCRWRWRAIPVVADAMERPRQNVQQEAPDELVWDQRHRAKPRPAVAAVILVAEGYAVLVEADQPAVRDGDAVGAAGEIGEHCLGSGKGRLGVNEPLLRPEWREVRGEGLAATQALDLAKERQPARHMGVGEARQEEPPE